jgi:short-subunit dehydrogenase
MSNPRPRALITGASSGIGLSYARHLARTGHDLIIVARRGNLLADLKRELEQAHNIDVEIIVSDLAQALDVARVAERIETGAPVDMLINNAGYAARGKVAALDPDALDEMLRVNVLALSRLSRSAMGRMVAQGRGSIINIASATVFLLLPGNAGYGSSKSYVAAFTRHMQLEAQGTGVRVQLLVPGVVATEFHRIAGADLTQFPPAMIMQVDDLVVASLRALEMDEEVCIPSLPELATWESYLAAERAVAADVSRDRIASRYHGRG